MVLQQLPIQLSFTPYTPINKGNDWAQSLVASVHSKYWKTQYFMKVRFLKCNVPLKPSCLILPFESIANDNSVLWCNWLMEKVQYAKKQRKERRGRKEAGLFFFNVIWQPDELWEFVKFKRKLSRHNCSFSVSWSSFNGKWNIISNFLSDSYNVLCLLVLNQSDFC